MCVCNLQNDVAKTTVLYELFSHKSTFLSAGVLFLLWPRFTVFGFFSLYYKLVGQKGPELMHRAISWQNAGICWTGRSEQFNFFWCICMVQSGDNMLIFFFLCGKYGHLLDKIGYIEFHKHQNICEIRDHIRKITGYNFISDFTTRCSSLNSSRMAGWDITFGKSSLWSSEETNKIQSSPNTCCQAYDQTAER